MDLNNKPNNGKKLTPIDELINDKTDEILKGQEKIINQLYKNQKPSSNVMGENNNIDWSSLSDEQIENLTKETNNQLITYMKVIISDKQTKCEHVFRKDPRTFKHFKWGVAGLFILMLLFGFIDLIVGICGHNDYCYNEIPAMIVSGIFLYAILRLKYKIEDNKFRESLIAPKHYILDGYIAVPLVSIKMSLQIVWIVCAVLLGCIPIANFIDGFIGNGILSMFSLFSYLAGIFLYVRLLAKGHDIVVYKFINKSTYKNETILFDMYDCEKEFFYFEDEYLENRPDKTYYFNEEETK